MDIKLILEKLNKIESKKGKIKYIEKLIFETRDKKLKERLKKLLKLIEKNGNKKLSFEEIHSEELNIDNKKENVENIENMISLESRITVPINNQRIESVEDDFEETYTRNFITEDRILPKNDEKIEKKIDYLPKEGYLEKEKIKEYKQLEEPEYIIKPRGKILEDPLEMRMGEGVDTRKSFTNVEWELSTSKKTEEGTREIGEYKRQEIFSKSLEEDERKRKEYLRKLSHGEV